MFESNTNDFEFNINSEHSENEIVDIGEARKKLENRKKSKFEIIEQLKESNTKLKESKEIMDTMMRDVGTDYDDIKKITVADLKRARDENNIQKKLETVLETIEKYKNDDGSLIFPDDLSICDISTKINERLILNHQILADLEEQQKSK